MRKCIVTILCSILLFGCGISNKDKDYMQTILNNELRRSYDREDIVAMINAELTQIEKKDNIYGGTYFGRFKCALSPLNNDDKVAIWGEVAFDDNKFVKIMPERYGKDKRAINISIILINNKPIDAKEIDSSKYVLDVFMNRNKVSGNEK